MNKYLVLSALTLAVSSKTVIETTYDDAYLPCYYHDSTLAAFVGTDDVVTFTDITEEGTTNSAGTEYNYAFEVTLSASLYYCDQVFT